MRDHCPESHEPIIIIPNHVECCEMGNHTGYVWECRVCGYREFQIVFTSWNLASELSRQLFPQHAETSIPTRNPIPQTSTPEPVLTPDWVKKLFKNGSQN